MPVQLRARRRQHFDGLPATLRQPHGGPLTPECRYNNPSTTLPRATNNTSTGYRQHFDNPTAVPSPPDATPQSTSAHVRCGNTFAVDRLLMCCAGLREPRPVLSGGRLRGTNPGTSLELPLRKKCFDLGICAVSFVPGAGLEPAWRLPSRGV